MKIQVGQRYRSTFNAIIFTVVEIFGENCFCVGDRTPLFYCVETKEHIAKHWVFIEPKRTNSDSS